MREVMKSFRGVGLVAGAVLLMSLAGELRAQITTPEQQFGFTLGTDRKLADWKELTAYYQKIASESDRVKYEELGKTSEGRPFVALTITSPENMKRLAEIQEINARLADPRKTTPEEAKELIAKGKTIFVVTCNVHSTEIASSQSCAQFVYLLASESTPEIQNILDKVVIVMVPSLNPDGQQLVVDWYKKYLGTPYEGVQPVVIWSKYTGHDDNRDWYAFTQVETQLTVNKVLNVWHPQMLYDLHQMGSNGPRLYLPPWVDPIDPNIDPLLVWSMNAVGTQTAFEVSETGKTGVLIHGVYDMWSPARHYVAYHGGLRILTESASVAIASPIDIPFEKLDSGIGYDAKVAAWNFPSPWKGGKWTLGDIVAYQKDAFFSLANNAAMHREQFLTDFYHVEQNATNQKYGGPYAYVIPAETTQTDPGATARLVNILRTGDVDVQKATASFEAGGKTYPAGSYIVPLGQPSGPFAKTVLEVQHYPNIEQYPGGPLQRPYDVTAQTLPLLLGVDAAAVDAKFSASATPVVKATVEGSFKKAGKGGGYVFGDEANADYYAAFALLKDGVHVERLTGEALPKGTFYVPAQPGVEAKLEAIASKMPVTIEPAAAGLSGTVLEMKLPRIALYQSWNPSMDEGWTRWIFDTNGIPYTRVVDADMRKGDLRSRFDVLVLPDEPARAILHGGGGRGEGGGAAKIPEEYRGGMGDAGIASLKAFTEQGGTVVAFNNASLVYDEKNLGGVKDRLASLSNKDFYVPGSILEVAVDTANPIGFGSKAKVPVFFEQSPAFEPGPDVMTVAHYDNPKPLLSGWLLGGKSLDGASALVQKKVGAGQVILFGFRPQYRGQSEVTYKMVFNALLSATETPGTVTASRKGRP
jgi:hypothetical protein